MKRQRGRNRNNNNNRHNNNPNRSLDSNGPDVKVRGNANTIYEKYVQLARDARSNGSRVKAENYLQHAEHYLRLVNIQEAEKKAREEERDARRAQHNQSNSKDAGDNEEGGNRRPRRDNRRPRHQDRNETEVSDENITTEDGKQSKPKKSKEAEDTPAGLDLIEPEAEAKPKRRRAAPKRKDKTEEAVDAAE